MSLFGILSVGGQALLTGRKAIDITSENLSNQDTEGYSRQRVHQQDITPNGVYVKDIERVFNNSVYKRILAVNQQVEGEKNYKDILSEVESLFNDIHGTGFGQKIEEFFNAFNDIAINPDDLAARDKVISVAKQLIGRIRDNYDNMQAIKDETVLSVKDQVKRLNDILVSLVKANKNIKAFRNDKTRLNNYLNERDRLLKELSGLIDIKVKIKSDETVDITTVKGHPLVLDDKYFSVKTEERNGKLRVFADNTDLTELFSNGKIGSSLKAIAFIEKKINDLNDFVSIFAAVVNKIHRQGYNLKGETNVDFFKISEDSSLPYINASNIALDINDAKDIAAAGDARYLNSDNMIVKGIISLKDYNQIATKKSVNAVSSADTFGSGSFDVYIGDRKLATVNYTSSDTLSDIADKINTSQSEVVAKVFEYPSGSGNQYLELFAKDLPKSKRIDLKNDSGTFVSTIGGLSNNKGFLNPAEVEGLKNGNLQIGDVKYQISNPDNYNIVENKSLNELYNKRLVAEIGFEIEHTKDKLKDNETFLNALEEKLKEISGVNTDEELANMLKYQRAYQSAAKIITVTDELLQTVLNMIK